MNTDYENQIEDILDQFREMLNSPDYGSDDDDEYNEFQSNFYGWLAEHSRNPR